MIDLFCYSTFIGRGTFTSPLVVLGCVPYFVSQVFVCVPHDLVMILLPVAKLILKILWHTYMTSDIHLQFTISKILPLNFKEYMNKLRVHFLCASMAIFPIRVYHCVLTQYLVFPGRVSIFEQSVGRLRTYCSSGNQGQQHTCKLFIEKQLLQYRTLKALNCMI